MASVAVRPFQLSLLLAALLFGGSDARCQDAPKASATRSSAPLAFSDQKGWLGADDAYSIPLGNGQSLWLFGDTFIGEKPDSLRTAKSGFIRNSVGITTCSGEKCSIEYFWAHMKGPKPDSLFAAPGTDWYWPLDGFIYNGTLYIALMQMHAEGSGAMGFAFSGTQMAVIHNYTETPDRWAVEYKPLNTGPNAVPGVSILIRQGPNRNPDPENPKGASYAYFFTLVQGTTPGAQHLGLLRIALDKLGAAARPAGSAWEYLKSSGDWGEWPKTDTLLPSDHAAMLTPGATEMSVRYHETTKQWIAVYPDPGMKKADYALSNSMTHGWQAPKTLFAYPEVETTNANYTPNVFCYAAKEHVELEHDGELMFTYACNSFKEEELFDKTKLYRPMPVTVPLPKM
jgi:Domain of unknown function (DUF4185)